MHQVVGGVIAAIPGGLVVDQRVNLSVVRGFLDGERVVETDGERFLHEDMDAVAGADLNDSTVIIGIGVDEHGLRVRFQQHLFQVGEENSVVEAVAGRGRREQARVGFGDADDFNLGAVQRLAEESVDVAVNQANDADAQRRMRGRGREGKRGDEE